MEFQIEIRPDDALVVVDPQNDFLPGGSLPVAEGNRIFEPVNRIAPLFAFVVATRDWHPPDHRYFADRGGPWPYHCLQDTAGAEFSAELEIAHVHEIVSKGTDPHTDGYSGFAGTELAHMLRRRDVKRVFVCGLATDYCVKATAIEALEHGFETVVLADAIAAVKLRPEDEEQALEAMRQAGAHIVTSGEIRQAT